jgi:thioredoxin-related protein
VALALVLNVAAGVAAARAAETEPVAAAQADAAEGAEPVAVAQAATNVAWVDYDQGRQESSERTRPLLINFTADWCKFCKKMKAETYTDPDVIAYLNEHYVTALVDTQKQPAIAQKYFVRGLPTIWFLNSAGERITNLPGYVDAPTFLQVLAFIAEEAYKTQSFADYIGVADQED